MARSKRPSGNEIHLGGIRNELRSALVRRVKQGDPRLIECGALSARERDQINERSPEIRSAKRRIEKIDAGLPIITGTPHWRRWPELEHVPGVQDRIVKRVFINRYDNTRPIHALPPYPPDPKADLAAILAELELPAETQVVWA